MKLIERRDAAVERGDLASALKLDDQLEDQGMHGDDRATCFTCQSWADHAHHPITGRVLTEVRLPLMSVKIYAVDRPATRTAAAERHLIAAGDPDGARLHYGHASHWAAGWETVTVSFVTFAAAGVQGGFLSPKPAR